MDELRELFSKNKWAAVALVSAVISAIVGGVFGYYGGTMVERQRIGSIEQQMEEPPGGNQDARDANEIFTPQTDDESRIIQVVERASKAVASIVAAKDLTVVDQDGSSSPFRDLCDDPFFRRFLGAQCDQPDTAPRQRTERQEIAAGSGFLVSSDGLILTNKHVVDIDADFTVILSDGRKFPAKVLAKDPVKDLAVLKITASSLPTLVLGNSDSIRIGQTVIAIGNALGQFSNTVSKGVVSGLSRSIVAAGALGEPERLDEVIQTDAAINPGNSGGPLLNLKGEVIGVNTAIVSGAQNIGFAIPINQAKRDLEQVKATGKITYPFLGVRYIIIDRDFQREKNLPFDYGALIVRGDSQTDFAVVPGSPADKAGLNENDIILEMDGRRITTQSPLAKAIQAHKVGDAVTLKVYSSGQTKIVRVTLGEIE
jgi:S1-C subfamily serine protease